jgi:hypothetical protein
VRLEGLSQLKKIHFTGTQTRDLPACSILPQPTTVPRVTKSCNVRDNYTKAYECAAVVTLCVRFYASFSAMYAQEDGGLVHMGQVSCGTRLASEIRTG